MRSTNLFTAALILALALSGTNLNALAEEAVKPADSAEATPKPKAKAHHVKAKKKKKAKVAKKPIFVAAPAARPVETVSAAGVALSPAPAGDVTRMAPPPPQPATPQPLAEAASQTPPWFAKVMPAKTASLLAKTVVWADYRLRVIRTSRDQVPPAGAESVDTAANHRIRAGAFVQVTPKFGAGARVNTGAARLGDLDTVGGTGFILGTPRFDQLYLGYHWSPETLINIGRGPARQYEADLVVGTGRYDEDNANNDSLTITHNISKQTTGYVIYSPVFTTNLLQNVPRYNFNAYALALAHEFDPDTQLHFFGGTLSPNRPVFFSGGEKQYTQATVRLDHRFDPKFAAFAAGAYQFSQTDGNLFIDVPTATSSDRSSFFGGVALGNADHLGENEVDFHYVKTGAVATSVLAEFPAGIEEARLMFQRQMVPEIRLTASYVRRWQDTLAPGVVRNDSDMAYVQLFSAF